LPQVRDDHAEAELMTLMPPVVNTLYLPWSVDTASVAMRQNQQFLRWLRRLFVVFILVGIILPLVPVPTLVNVQPVMLPERLSRVVVELPEAKPQAPAPVKPVPEPLPKPLSKPLPKPVEASSPVVPSNQKQEPSPELPPSEPSAQEVAEATRQRAKRSGLLQFQDQLQAMRELAAVDHRASDLVGETKAALPQRQLVGRSKGHRPSPSASLATAVDAVILPDQAFGALARVSENMAENTGPSGAPAMSTRAPDQLRGRADEEIRSVMDRNKGAIFAIYNRALRSKPLLRGKLTIEMVIAADGTIMTAVLVASDLGEPELESRLLTRIRMITFSAAAVAATTLNYSFEFLPG
jgi:hypothetical protein